MEITTTFIAPAAAIVAWARLIESAPPEQATPYRPGPTRPIAALTAALTGSTGTVLVMQPDLTPMTHRHLPPSGPLARLRAQRAGPRGYRRIDALLSSEDAPAAIAALSPGEIFELVHEVGFEDAQPLLELATPQQIKGCFDLEGWTKDELEVAGPKPWLASLMETGFEKLGAVWG